MTETKEPKNENFGSELDHKTSNNPLETKDPLVLSEDNPFKKELENNEQLNDPSNKRPALVPRIESFLNNILSSVSILRVLPLYLALTFVFIVLMGLVKVLLKVQKYLDFYNPIREHTEYLISIFSFGLLIHLLYSIFTSSFKRWKKKSDKSGIEAVRNYINKEKDNSRTP